VFTIGFALIMTPGRVGEAIKLFLLRERAGVPVATSASVLVLERAAEAAGLIVLALASSFFLPWAEGFLMDRKLALVGVALLALALTITFWRPIVALVPRLPLARRVLARPGPARLWSNLVRGGERVLRWRALLPAVGISLLARTCDGIAIFWIAGLYGVGLSLPAACFILGSSAFIGGISMLPGGAGAAEVTLIGLLLAFGAGPAAALATALTARTLIFWLWVALGLGLALRHRPGAWDEATEGRA